MTDKELDEALYKNLNEEGIIRMKAVEYTVEFLKDKNISNFDAFDNVFNRVYNSLKNGNNRENFNSTSGTVR
jgi:hypothetical protein